MLKDLYQAIVQIDVGALMRINQIFDRLQLANKLERGDVYVDTKCTGHNKDNWQIATPRKDVTRRFTFVSKSASGWVLENFIGKDAMHLNFHLCIS